MINILSILIIGLITVILLTLFNYYSTIKDVDKELNPIEGFEDDY